MEKLLIDMNAKLGAIGTEVSGLREDVRELKMDNKEEHNAIERAVGKNTRWRHRVTGGIALIVAAATTFKLAAMEWMRR